MTSRARYSNPPQNIEYFAFKAIILFFLVGWESLDILRLLLPFAVRLSQTPFRSNEDLLIWYNNQLFRYSERNPTLNLEYWSFLEEIANLLLVVRNSIVLVIIFVVSGRTFVSTRCLSSTDLCVRWFFPFYYLFVLIDFPISFGDTLLTYTGWPLTHPLLVIARFQRPPRSDLQLPTSSVSYNRTVQPDCCLSKPALLP